jgi:hypothetical protein
MLVWQTKNEQTLKKSLTIIGMNYCALVWLPGSDLGSIEGGCNEVP